MIKTDLLPCLPLRDIVVFPGMLVPLFVGRDKSIKALNEVMKTSKKIILVTQKNAEIDDPTGENLYSFGCESKVLQLLKLPDGTVKVLVEGLNRIKILECKNDKDFIKTSGEVVVDTNDTKEDLVLRAQERLPSIVETEDLNIMNFHQLGLKLRRSAGVKSKGISDLAGNKTEFNRWIGRTIGELCKEEKYKESTWEIAEVCKNCQPTWQHSPPNITCPENEPGGSITNYPGRGY